MIGHLADDIIQIVSGIDVVISACCQQWADGYVNYVKGANVAGFMKVAKATMAQGIV